MSEADADADILSKLGFSGLTIDDAEGVETWEKKASEGSSKIFVIVIVCVMSVMYVDLEVRDAIYCTCPFTLIFQCVQCAQLEAPAIRLLP
jgi:hypothetical protein